MIFCIFLGITEYLFEVEQKKLSKFLAYLMGKQLGLDKVRKEMRKSA